MPVVVDVENLLLQRVTRLKAENPGIKIHDEVFPGMAGEWGLISVLDDDDRPKETEFIESETSWLRPNAAGEYNSAAAGGRTVSIIVPDSVIDNVTEELNPREGMEITVCGYSSMGLFPRPMAY